MANLCSFLFIVSVACIALGAHTPNPKVAWPLIIVPFAVYATLCCVFN